MTNNSAGQENLDKTSGYQEGVEKLIRLGVILFLLALLLTVLFLLSTSDLLINLSI